MEQAAKKAKGKKRRVGLTILLVLLALILLLAAGSYIYLSADHYPVAEIRSSHPYSDTFTGPKEYQNRQVTMGLDEAELYWMADTYGLLDVSIPNAVINDYAVELQGDALYAYLDVTYGGFLPLPLKAKVTLGESRGSTLELNIEEVHLGKWLTLPPQLLQKFGLEESYTVNLHEIVDDVQFKNVSLQDGLLSVTTELTEAYAKGIAPDQTADTLIFYGEPAEGALAVASACSRSAGSNALEMVASYGIVNAEDPLDMVTKLLALTPNEPEASYLEQFSAFEQRYVVPITVSEVAAQRAAYKEVIASYNRQLQTLLDGLRTKYSALDITLGRKEYLDSATGEPLSVSALAPELGLQDEDCRVMLLTATEPKKYPLAAGMPPLAEIPKERGLKLKDTVATIPYDIGAILPLTSGDYAMLYYFSTGEMVIHCLPDAMVEEMLTTYAVPRVLNLDTAVYYGISRTIQKAPADDLKDYILYLPEAVEAVYAQNHPAE